MKNILMITIVSMVIVSANIKAQELNGIDTIYKFQFNGYDYELFLVNRTFAEAAALAVSRGGKLCEIDNKEEQDSVFANVNRANINTSLTMAPDGGGASYLWIGGNDIGTEGVWIVDGDNDGIGEQFWQGDRYGSAVGGLFNNWGNEPDNYNNQDALGFALTSWPYGTPGQWNDIDQDNSLFFLVEYETQSNIENDFYSNDINIFPNPLNGEFLNLRINSNQVQNIEIKVTDVQGRVISDLFESLMKGENILQIDFKVNDGIYFIQVVGGEINFIDKLIVK